VAEQRTMRCRRCIYTLLRHNVFCTCASNDRHFRDRSPLFEALERLLQPLEHEMQRQARNARTLKVDRFAASRVAAVSVASTFYSRCIKSSATACFYPLSTFALKPPIRLGPPRMSCHSARPSSHTLEIMVTLRTPLNWPLLQACVGNRFRPCRARAVPARAQRLVPCSPRA